MTSLSCLSASPYFPHRSSSSPFHREITSSAYRSRIAKDYASLAACSQPMFCGSANKFGSKVCCLKLWILQDLNLQRPRKRSNLQNSQQEENSIPHVQPSISAAADAAMKSQLPSYAQHEENSARCVQFDNSSMSTSMKSPSVQKSLSSITPFNSRRTVSLSIAVIGATGELARMKIFPALFALYYGGFLPENVSIFGYSSKDLTDDDLRSVIAATITCRIDQQQNCEEKMDAFLRRMFYVNGGYDNTEGMSKLNLRMAQVEGEVEANRIFYLSVPREALLDVASSLADHAQSHRGWNRVIIEKPFGSNTISSHQLTSSLLSKFNEKQLYRIDHLLGRNTIENLTVLRFSNLVFMPLWNRNYIHNVQIIISDDSSLLPQTRYCESYGIIGDIVHSHIFQTIALLAMEPPVTLDGEDVRNEKVKLLRSIRKLEPSDVILGQCKATYGGNYDGNLGKRTPSYFAAALYIDNARWDDVPFLIRAGRGLSRQRVEIRIQFRNVPGNIYHKHVSHNLDLSNNVLILHDVPDEAILVKVNNKIPGLGTDLDVSELNLLYKEKYNIEVPDSYEQLLHDVIDGDNHLFMRSDEVAAAWNILSPVLHAMDKNNLVPEVYETGGRGPDKAIYLWAKHGVRWLDD